MTRRPPRPNRPDPLVPYPRRFRPDVVDEAGARAAAGADAAIHDLHGATMLPGFVDAHSHFSAMMQMAGGLDLDDPSLPPVTDIPSLPAAIRAFLDARALTPGGRWGGLHTIGKGEVWENGGRDVS